MNNFNYNNYIGPHMSEPLRVVNERGKVNYVESWNHKTGELCLRTTGVLELGFFALATNHKPLLKSVADLTDEEWLYVLNFSHGNKNIDIDSVNITPYFVQFEFESYGITYMLTYHLNNNNMDTDCDDDDFSYIAFYNALYSLHVSLDAENGDDGRKHEN